MSKIELFLYLYKKKYLSMFFKVNGSILKENFIAFYKRKSIVDFFLVLECIIFFVGFPIVYPIFFISCKKAKKTSDYIRQKKIWDDMEEKQCLNQN